MIEISNAFILVWLVVLAVICIYLLYMSLTRNNESDSLKATLTNLVKQNKKRDELINFLMERVETLSGTINTLTNLPVLLTDMNIQMQPNVIENDISTNNAVSEITTELKPVVNITPEKLSIDDVLNSITNDSNFLPVDNMESYTLHDTNLNNNTTDISTQEATNSLTAESNITNNCYLPAQTTESVDNNDKSPNKLMHCLNLDDVLNSIPSTFKDDDLISTILGVDDSASQQCKTDADDVSDLPAEKLKLLGMNVKQLKQLAKDMNVKSRGTKTDLVDAIWDKMIKKEVPAEKLDETVNTFNFIDNIDKIVAKNIEILDTDQLTVPSIDLVVEELPDDI